MKIVAFWSCGVLVIPFAITGILFGIFKEKATKFVAGFIGSPAMNFVEGAIEENEDGIIFMFELYTFSNGSPYCLIHKTRFCFTKKQIITPYIFLIKFLYGDIRIFSRYVLIF